MAWSTCSSASIVSLRALPLVALAALGLALAGCGGGIDGAPTCDAKKANLQGQVGANTVNVDASFSGGLKQSSSGGTLDGTLGSSNGSMHLTWANQVADGEQTSVSGQLSLAEVMGGAVCVGDGSTLEVESAGNTTFHLVNLTNCASGGSLSGEILGCAGF
jgi:hypothetical protein